MKNKMISIILGALLGIIPAYGAYQSQYQRYIPQKEEPKASGLTGSEKTEYPEDETAITVQGESPHIVREDTLLHFDEDIPYEVQECAQLYGDMYGICPEFLEAVAFAESSYIPTATNGSCIGLMQINLDCEEQILRMESFGLSEADMTEVDASMLVAASYLKELFDDYEDPAEVLIRYNGDRTGLRKYRDSGEISEYAMKVLKLSEELERKHGK